MRRKKEREPFIEHLRELQLRLVYSAIALGIGGAIGYAFQSQLVRLIVQPLGSKLYYSNPAGGFSFLFNVCLLAAVLFAIPVVLYNVMRFMLPALPSKARFSIPAHLLVSVLLAAAGVLFAYVYSLPAALHFLNTFGDGQVQPLIFAGEYLRFVITYLISFAILFQLPVVINIIDKITPLKPGKMMKFQRWIILVSFVVAAAITPTPDPLNQAIMAAPIVFLYQFSVVHIAFKHHRRKKHQAAFKLPSLGLPNQPVLEPVPIPVETAEPEYPAQPNPLPGQFFDVQPPARPKKPAKPTAEEQFAAAVAAGKQRRAASTDNFVFPQRRGTTVQPTARQTPRPAVQPISRPVMLMQDVVPLSRRMTA
jgi:sec-independent protein translocase protein TatC